MRRTRLKKCRGDRVRPTALVHRLAALSSRAYDGWRSGEAPHGAADPSSAAFSSCDGRRCGSETRGRARRVVGSWAVVFLASAAVGLARADDNPLGLSQISSPELRQIYLAPQLDYLTPHVQATFANSLRWQQARFGWTPSQPVTVFLKDFSDFGNAGATPMPLNALGVEIEPASNDFETDPGSERMATLMKHELVHLATTDIASSQDRFWRGLLFGKVSPQPSDPESLIYSYLTVPRFNVPRWQLEGAAVFMETWMSGGFGRGQGGYDEMVFRAMVRDGTPFYDPLSLESRGVRVDFQVGVNAYLYGTRFFTWLALVYSPDRVVTWLRRDEGSERHYAAAFEQVFGLPLDTAWQDWIAFEKDFQQRNLVALRKVPITPLRPIVRQALGSSSRLFADPAGSMLYGAFRRPGIVEFIGAVDTRDGSVRPLANLAGGVLFSVTSLAFDPTQRTLFFTTNNLDQRDLMSLDVATGRQTLLISRGRIGDLVFDASERALYGVRHAAGLATLVRIPYPFRKPEELYTFPYEVVPAHLDVSPDGASLSASVKEVNGDQSLRIWSIAALREGRLAQTAAFSFGQAAPEGFVFSPDGRFLYGSSYYTGVSNIFRAEPATGATEAVTNAEVGVFRPLPLADGRLVVLAYTGQGFVPSIVEHPVPLPDVSAIRFLGTDLVDAHPDLKTWQLAPLVATDTLEPATPPRPYDPRREVTFLNAYPVLQGYKETTGLGYRANFADPLGFANGALVGAVTPDHRLKPSEQVHLAATGNYLGYSGSVSLNRSDFYDIFGPTQRSRKGFAAKLSDQIPLLDFDRYKHLDLRWDIAHYRGIDTLPTAQNVASSVRILTTAGASLTYTNLYRSLGAVDDEQGISAVVAAKGNFAPGVRTVQWRGNVDAGLALPWDHTSLWSRTASGVAGGSRGNPLASFYFGAFGNNRLDDGEVRRYRDFDSLPGFSIDQIAALSFVRQTVELDLPPVVFASVGYPDLHLNWMRPALFATGLRTDPQSPARRANHESIGTQVDFRFSVLHWYEAILSIGVAEGFDGRKRSGHEGLVSLKIL